MRGTKSRLAFDYFKNGMRERGYPPNEKRWQASQAWFEKAIAEDTGKTFAAARTADAGYPRAWSWMAYGVVLAYFEGWSTPYALGDAVEFADRSVRLDEYDYDNHWVAAFVHLIAGDQDAVEYHMSEALELNAEDRNMCLLVEMADVLVWLGRTDEAIKMLERARRVSDLNRWSLAWGYYFKGQEDPDRYDDALAELNLCYWKPGQEPFEHDMLLLTGAIYAQQAAIQASHGNSAGAASLQSLAEAALTQFRLVKPSWAISDELRRMPFAKNDAAQSALEHWKDGLTKMGLSV